MDNLTSFPAELEARTGLSHWRILDPWRRAASIGYHLGFAHGGAGLEWACSTGFTSGDYPYFYRPTLHHCKGAVKTPKVPHVWVQGDGAGYRQVVPPPNQVDASAWAVPIAELLAPVIIETKNQWERAAAAVLEGLSADIRRMVIPLYGIDRTKLPPGFRTRRVVMEARTRPAQLTVSRYRRDSISPNGSWVYDGNPPIWNFAKAEIIPAAWEVYEKIMDPPGYAWRVDGAQHGVRLWSWWWAGRDMTQSDCPKPRVTARLDAWQDFWAGQRTADPF